ncbi:hypothetical protein [Roseofilum capinflatum]|uniref:Uncharacterized protein n=1 Tax=Roseofilum capinflatum BLCC-M114 TaxID=3022440 RepID=A0ABT7B647_9CYAN|nr:hypothetical protein [Roseofilum capinflatum]MDJ1174648.1 hypothetical protein [Roseofilum capinflatum BLCC-M114]
MTLVKIFFDVAPIESGCTNFSCVSVEVIFFANNKVKILVP